MNELLVLSKKDSKIMVELFVGLKNGECRLYLTHGRFIESRLAALDPNISEYYIERLDD